MTNRVNMRLPLVMTAAALVTLAGGCTDRSTDADKAVHAQAREMQALSAGGTAPAPRGVESKAMNLVSTDLTPHLSSTVAGEKSAASMMLAQSNLNLAEQAMGDVGEAERQCSALISQVDGYLVRWRTHQAVKIAAESYDPSAELAEIASTKLAKDKEIATERQNKAKLEAQLSDLKSKAKQKMDEVAGREAEYGKLMEQAARLSATEGVALVEQANGIKREADLLRMAGTKLEAQAGVIEPEVREVAAIINQLENQKKDLEGTEVALAKQLSDRKSEAAEAGAAAQAAAGQISQAMAEVAEARDKVEVAYNAAQSQYSKGVSAAKEASRESPAAGKALLGDAYVGAGFMHWQRAQGLRVYTALLNSLSRVEPALSDKAKYTQAATEASEQAKTATTSAAESLEQAKTQFSGVRRQWSTRNDEHEHRLLVILVGGPRRRRHARGDDPGLPGGVELQRSDDGDGVRQSA